jgi:hypothetical protein
VSYYFDQKPPTPERVKWSEWSPQKPYSYMVVQLFLNFIVPGIIGLTLTVLGLFINVLLIDLIFYVSDKTK